MSRQEQQQYAPEVWDFHDETESLPESQAYAQYSDSPGGVDYYDQQQHGFDMNCSSHIPVAERADPPPLLADAIPVASWPMASHAAFDSTQQQQQQQRVDGYPDAVDYPGPRDDYDHYQQQHLQQDHTVPSPDQTSSSYSPYLSTHHTSEDDDETGARQVHRDDGQGGVGDDAKKKQTAAQRRIRNRESMRRTRMKEKEALTTLRATLTHLECRFKQLTQWESASSSGPQRCNMLQQKLANVVQLKRELEAEKDAVLHFLEEKRASMAELQHVLAQCQLEDHDGGDAQRTREKLALLEEQARKHSLSSTGPRGASSTQPFEFGFTALSAMQINELLATFCSNLQRVKELGRAATSHKGIPHPFLEVFGWQTHRHIDEQNQMHFEFVKAFPHWSTQEIVDRAWKDTVDLKQYKENHSNIRRMEFLQRVNERLGIVVREIKHPTENTIFRTHYAIFMLEAPGGFLFGIQSINPTPEQQKQMELDQENQQQGSDALNEDTGPGDTEKEKVVWVDALISIEFQRQPREDAVVSPLSSSGGEHGMYFQAQVDDGSRQDYCEVQWRGKTNYKTSKHAAESAVGFLLGILKWENDVIGPRFHLTSS